MVVVTQPTLDDTFEQFWRSYPRRTAKGEARKAWQRLHPTPDLVQQILIALAWQRLTPQWTKDDGQFIPYPASWIRAERWLDEPIEAPTPATSEPWFTECRRLHGGQCEKSLTHFHRMQREKKATA